MESGKNGETRKREPMQNAKSRRNFPQQSMKNAAGFRTDGFRIGGNDQIVRNLAEEPLPHPGLTWRGPLCFDGKDLHEARSRRVA